METAYSRGGRQNQAVGVAGWLTCVPWLRSGSSVSAMFTSHLHTPTGLDLKPCVVITDFIPFGASVPLDVPQDLSKPILLETWSFTEPPPLDVWEQVR